MRRVEFNDGEGIVYSDFNILGQLSELAVSKFLNGMALLEGPYAADLRLISGSDFSLSGTENRTITLTSGLYVQQDSPADDDALPYKVGLYAGGSFTLDARTSGAVFRVDIIQAKIDDELAGEAESRDFEDAVTGVVTTSSTNKRRNRSVTVSVKKGTDQASEQAAVDNIPAPDAGYTTIYAIKVDSAGNVSEALDVWDFHRPIGHADFRTHAGSTLRDSGWTVDTTQRGGVIMGATSTLTAFFHCPVASRMRRISQIRVWAKIEDNGSAFHAVPQDGFGSGFAVAPSGVYDGSGDYDLKSQLTTLTSWAVTQTATPTIPLWCCGGPNRNANNAGMVLKWVDDSLTDFGIAWVEWKTSGY